MPEIQPKVSFGAHSGSPIPIKVLADGTVSVSISGGLPPNLESVDTANTPVPPPNAALVVATFPYIHDVSGQYVFLTSSSAFNDGVVPQTTGNQVNIATLWGFNGSTFDRIRIANVFKTAFVTAAGNNAVWTPAAGKKFRLMGYTIDVGGTTAATGPNRIILEDNVTGIRNHVAQTIQTQTANISGGDSHMGADLGQGYLSAAANNVLNINLAFAMVTGGVAVNVWGTEE